MLALAAVFLLTWVGSALLISAWQRRPARRDLAARLAPFAGTSRVGCEAERWLRDQ